MADGVSDTKKIRKIAFQNMQKCAEVTNMSMSRTKSGSEREYQAFGVYFLWTHLWISNFFYNSVYCERPLKNDYKKVQHKKSV